MTRALCPVTDLDATGAKEILLTKDGAPYPIFLVKDEDRVFAYVNSCPHARLPLNTEPDAFFNVTRSYLVCANHGAHFDTATGKCLRGPCKNESLQSFPVTVMDGMVVIA